MHDTYLPKADLITIAKHCRADAIEERTYADSWIPKRDARAAEVRAAEAALKADPRNADLCRALGIAREAHCAMEANALASAFNATEAEEFAAYAEDRAKAAPY